MNKFLKKPPKENKIFQFITSRPILMILSIVWTFFVARQLVLILLVMIIVVYATITIHKKKKLLYMLWVILFLLPIIPIDIAFPNFSGPPRFVPYIVGLANYELQEKAKKGEVILGGCQGSLFPPEWVLVW